MWIKEPGKIVDGLDFIGTYELSLYLLRGKEAMIIGGGMSYIAPSLEEQFPMIGLEPDKLKYLVILHSHFDHCGAVPYLKRKFPHMQVLASAHTAEVLSKKKVVDYIYAADKETVDRIGLQSEYERLNLKFDGVQVDRVVAENDIIDLGDGVEAHIIEVPGHTKCSIAVYVPKLKALFTADSIPVPTDTVDHLCHPSPQYDLALYKESLEKMIDYDIEICTFEHHGAITGDQARKLLHESLRLTDELEKHIVELYQQTSDLDKIAQKLTDERLEVNQFDFGSRDIWANVAKAEVRNVLRYAGLID